MKFFTATAFIISLSGSVLAAPARDAVDSALLKESHHMKAAGSAPSMQHKRTNIRCEENDRGNGRSGRTAKQEINTGSPWLGSRSEAVDASVENSERVSDEASKNMVGGSMAKANPSTHHSPMQARSKMAMASGEMQDANAANAVGSQETE